MFKREDFKKTSPGTWRKKNLNTIQEHYWRGGADWCVCQKKSFLFVYNNFIKIL